MAGPVTFYKTRVPRRHQQRITDARIGLRARVDPRRPLPGLLVIGAQRCGTSSLYKYLEAHPLLLASLRKETNYFSRHFGRGEGWYRAHFAARARHAVLGRRHGRPPIAFEASPYYLFHPLAPARAKVTVPDAKLIVILRDPVERAWSHFSHVRRLGKEPLSFEDALAAEPARLATELGRLADDPSHMGPELNRYSYAAKGRYAEQLERWLAHFDRSQLLALRTEDLVDRPRQVLRDVARFLDVPESYPRLFANHSYPGGAPERSSVPHAARELLQASYAAQNRRLVELLGPEFDWNDAATATA